MTYMLYRKRKLDVINLVHIMSVLLRRVGRKYYTYIPIGFLGQQFKTAKVFFHHTGRVLHFYVRRISARKMQTTTSVNVFGY